jgi:hypothetical protein
MVCEGTWWIRPVDTLAMIWIYRELFSHHITVRVPKGQSPRKDVQTDGPEGGGCHLMGPGERMEVR